MLRMKKCCLKLSCTIGLNVIFGLLVKQAFAQATDPVITIDERTISIPLPESAYKGNDAAIATELDGYDISAFSQISGNILEIHLDTPLAKGKHSLSVSLFFSDGEIESLFYQDVYVDGTVEPKSNWQVNATFSNSYLVDYKEDQNYQNLTKNNSNAAFELAGDRQWGEWTISGSANAIYDSASENDPYQKNWALPEYHLSSTYQGRNAAGTVGVGNINVDQESLLFSSFQRRGAAVDVLSDSDRYQLKVFNVQPDSTTRIDGDLITSDSTAKENVGMTAGIYLPDQRLKVSAGYIGGETTLGATSISGMDKPTVYGGDSWNLALDSVWMNNSLWLHLEHAQSEFDSDGLGIGIDEERDGANQIMLQLSSNGDLGSGWFDFWAGSLQYKSVGKAFYSLGNIYLPGDSELTRLHFSSSHGGIGFEAEMAREQNNIDNDSLYPTQTHDRTGFTINYTPMNLNPQLPLWSLLGSPSLTTRLYRIYHHQPDADALLAGYDLDNRVDESELNLTFNHPYWNWGLQYQLVVQDDRSQAVSDGDYILYEPPSDQRNKLIGLQLGLLPNKRISLNIQLQWNKRYEVDLANTYRSRNLGVDALFQLVPETLTLHLNYNYSNDNSSLSDALLPEDDFISQSGNTQLTWHALKAKGSRPALDIYFRGSYGKQDNRTFALVEEQWTANLGLNMHWAAGGQE
jgi:hypothetical protein